MRSATSRCWPPSWRSRSIRRRSLSAAARMRARDSCSSSLDVSTRSARRWFSSQTSAKPPTASRYARCSLSPASWMSAATGPVSDSMTVTARSEPSSGSHAGHPSAVTQPSPSRGRGYTSSSDGSMTTLAIALRRSSVVCAARSRCASSRSASAAYSRQLSRPARNPSDMSGRLSASVSASHVALPSSITPARRRTIQVPSETMRTIAHSEDGEERAPHEARRVLEPVRQAPHDEGGDQDRDRLPDRDDAVRDPSGGRRQQGERVVRAVGRARDVVGRDRELLDEEPRRDVEDPHERHDRSDEQAVRAAGQPSRGERQHQVDERDLGHPGGHAADAVRDRSRGRAQGHEAPSHADGDEQAPEPGVGRLVPGVQPDGDRRADHERVAQRQSLGRGHPAAQRDEHGRGDEERAERGDADDDRGVRRACQTAGCSGLPDGCGHRRKPIVRWCEGGLAPPEGCVPTLRRTEYGRNRPARAGPSALEDARLLRVELVVRQDARGLQLAELGQLVDAALGGRGRRRARPAARGSRTAAAARSSCWLQRFCWRRATRPETAVAVPATTAVRPAIRSSPGMGQVLSFRRRTTRRRRAPRRRRRAGCAGCPGARRRCGARPRRRVRPSGSRT